MKKFFAFAISAALFAACGDDNSSSAPEETSSSSEETILSSSAEENTSSSSTNEQAKESSSSTEVISSDAKAESSSSATQEESSSATGSSSSEATSSSAESSSSEYNDDPSAWYYDLTRPLAFIDTANKRYNYTEGYCSVDNKKYKWVSKDESKGVVNYDLSDYRDPSSYEPEKLQFVGYKLSNDTLYECTSYTNDCSQPQDAYVYIGNSSSIFGTWNFIGYLDDGQFHPISSEKNRLEISPESFKIHSSFTMPPFYYSHLHCSLVNKIINDENFIKLCNEKFEFIDYPNTIVTDTVRLSDNIWVARLGDDGVITSINGKIIESHYSYKVDPVTVLKEIDQTATYNGVECTLSNKQVDIMTKETCENLDPAMFYFDNPFDINNNREFNSCIAQYDIYKKN